MDQPPTWRKHPETAIARASLTTKRQGAVRRKVGPAVTQKRRSWWPGGFVTSDLEILRRARESARRDVHRKKSAPLTWFDFPSRWARRSTRPSGSHERDGYPLKPPRVKIFLKKAVKSVTRGFNIIYHVLIWKITDRGNYPEEKPSCGRGGRRGQTTVLRVRDGRPRHIPPPQRRAEISTRTSHLTPHQYLYWVYAPILWVAPEDPLFTKKTKKISYKVPPNGRFTVPACARVRGWKRESHKLFLFIITFISTDRPGCRLNWERERARKFSLFYIILCAMIGHVLRFEPIGNMKKNVGCAGGGGAAVVYPSAGWVWRSADWTARWYPNRTTSRPWRGLSISSLFLSLSYLFSVCVPLNVEAYSFLDGNVWPIKKPKKRGPRPVSFHAGGRLELMGQWALRGGEKSAHYSSGCSLVTFALTSAHHRPTRQRQRSPPPPPQTLQRPSGPWRWRPTKTIPVPAQLTRAVLAWIPVTYKVNALIKSRYIF